MTFKTINLMNNTKKSTLRQALINANEINLIESVSPLTELWSLRKLIAACETRIKEISDQAIAEALTYTESGQFMHDQHTFQIQQTCTFDFSDYHRYNTSDAATWREKQREKAELQKKVSALTASMKTIMDNYAVLYDKEPDEVKLTVKVID
jgi:hypothetical protein